ncbi:MAG: type II secretion system protein GspD [Gammaproteobacteria bacterium]|nr:type II secretion system protein GspD [Gammaproteobacteria bacterium]
MLRPTCGTCVLLIALLCGQLFAPITAQAAEQTWKINIKNAELKEFVTQVADITGKTFVVDPRIKGNVTVISSTAMDKEAVYALFLSVLRVHNFIAMPSGDIIRITPNAQGRQTPGPQGALDDLAPEELVTRVIAAQNVDSAELVKILRPIMPQYGHLAAVAKPNIVILTDHADNMIRLLQIIEQIDIANEDEVVLLQLKHAWVGTLVTLLELLAPEQIGRSAVGPQRINLIANERNNTIVVRGKPRPVAEILKLVEKLDRPTTAAGSTQVFKLRFADATDIAELLSQIITDQTQAEGNQLPPSIQADPSLNAIVVRADRSQMTEIEDILDQLDVRRAQVLIEAAIVEISITDTLDIGVEFAAVDADGSAVPLITTPLNGAINSLLAALVPDEDGEVDFISGLASVNTPTIAVAKIDAGGISFAAIVQALSTSSNANLLSTPSLLTLDNQEAKIVVGNEVPFRTGSFSTSGDGSDNPFTTIQREDVGLTLTVTPHVLDGRTVRLEVYQEITAVVPTPIGDNGFSDVVTSKRTIETTVLAEDRQTIVLGGLIVDDISETDRRVPFFGSIPGIGRLFRSDSDSRTKRNLLIFLRPTIIRSPTDADQETERKYRDIWEVEILSSGEQPPDLETLFEGRKLESRN